MDRMDEIEDRYVYYDAQAANEDDSGDHDDDQCAPGKYPPHST